MPFADYRQKRSSASSPMKLAMLLFVLVFVPHCQVLAASDSFIYCLDNGAPKIAAGRVSENGDLTFGVSDWTAEGHNLTVFGRARATGDGVWEYAADLGGPIPASRCRLHIRRNTDGSLVIQADPSADCQERGGQGTEIGAIKFPKASYEGPVLTELDSSDAFQKAGKCVAVKN